MSEYENNERLFNPNWAGYIVDFDENVADWRQLRFTKRADPDDQFTATASIVVAIDGACRGNGTPNAQAAYGLYFGPNSPMNTQARLLNSTLQTIQAAEFQAVIETLEIAHDVMGKSRGDSRVVLMTNSSYLVKSITEYIWSWIENGSKGSKRKLEGVVNRRALEDLHHAIEEMENDGVCVEFWLIRRKENQDANRLANLALDIAINPAPTPGSPAPTMTPEVKFSLAWDQAWDHWNHTASTLAEARALAQRLKLELPDSDRLNPYGALRYPLRRLVTTGQDTPKNFHLLMGPNWKRAIEDEWMNYRVWILKHEEEVRNPGEDTWHFYGDYRAPFVKPRAATKKERSRLENDQ